MLRMLTHITLVAIAEGYDSQDAGSLGPKAAIP